MMTSCSRTSIQDFSSLESHDYTHSEKDDETSILIFSSIEELNQTIDLGLHKDSRGLQLRSNGGVDEFGNIKKYGIDIADNPDVVLHAGSFYAAGYYKGWAGYRLYW